MVDVREQRVDDVRRGSQRVDDDQGQMVDDVREQMVDDVRRGSQRVGDDERDVDDVLQNCLAANGGLEGARMVGAALLEAGLMKADGLHLFCLSLAVAQV